MIYPVLFITGIDTDIGKTVAAGWLARSYAEAGERVTTQKLIQTGSGNIAEDIIKHRQIQGIGLTAEDRAGLTAPVIYRYPCSPHLAARLENRPVDIAAIDRATAYLTQRYDRVLIEGAGGLCVPLSEDLSTAEYIRQRGYPVVIVSSARLGSINHTVLTLQACEHAAIFVHSLIYNHYHDTDLCISEDSAAYLKRYLAKHHPQAQFLSMPRLSITDV